MHAMNNTTFLRGAVLLAALLVGSIGAAVAQEARNVLFVGNSYTSVNNLPQMVGQIAASMGDQLTWQSNTPGGCRFSQHCTNQSMTLIRGGGWDAVVLQEQSQYPAFPQWQVEAQVFPYAERLVDSVYAHNPCCEPMFYMTWGRKYGDADNAPGFPVLGTYEGMDSLLCERYTYMAQQYDAALCPVGRVWRMLRKDHPEIELYQQDNSHPSLAGTYAAACAFYVLLFHRDPDSIGYNASLPIGTAQTIRSVVRTVVYEQLTQWQRPQPQAAMTATTDGVQTATFTGTVLHADSLEWHFGDGSTLLTSATQTTVEHRYTDSGDYVVTLVARRHCLADSATAAIHIAAPAGGTGIAAPKPSAAVVLSPNPASQQVRLTSTAAEPLEVTIHDMSGRLVWRQLLSGQETRTVDVGRWPTGEYTMSVGLQHQRLMVVH